MLCGPLTIQSLIAHDINHVKRDLSLEIKTKNHDESHCIGRVLRDIRVLCGGSAAHGRGHRRDYRQRALHPAVLLPRKQDQHLPLTDGVPGLGGLPLSFLLPLCFRGKK